MGNAFSEVVQLQKKEEVNIVIADVMNTFLLRFLIHYKNRIVMKYTGSIDSNNTIISNTTKQLHQCPLIDVPLISGYISKQRYWLKSWSDRYVIIRNKADNYRIDYYSNWKNPPDKNILKGSIYPVGYYIESFLSDSEKESLNGIFCIKLSPLSTKKRPWYLKVIKLLLLIIIILLLLYNII